MKNLKFVGPQHYREISEADWASAGITDQGDVKVAGDNAFVRVQDYNTSRVVELSDDAAQFLLTTEPDLWEETEDEAGMSPIASRQQEEQQRAEAAQEAEVENLEGSVPTGSIKSVMDWVGDDKIKAQAALEVEQAKDADDLRTTLVEKLQAIIEDDDDEEEDDDDEEDSEDDD